METLTAFLLAPINATLSAFVFSRLWLWFLVPLGLPVIGMAHSYGIITVVSLPMISLAVMAGESTKMPAWMLSMAYMLATLIVWGSGAIAHGLM